MNDSTKSSNDAGENSVLTPEQKRERQKLAMKRWREKNPGYQKTRRELIRAGTWPNRHGNTQPSTEAQSSPVEAPVQPEGHAQA